VELLPRAPAPLQPVEIGWSFAVALGFLALGSYWAERRTAGPPARRPRGLGIRPLLRHFPLDPFVPSAVNPVGSATVATETVADALAHPRAYVIRGARRRWPSPRPPGGRRSSLPLTGPPRGSAVSRNRRQRVNHHVHDRRDHDWPMRIAIETAKIQPNPLVPWSARRRSALRMHARDGEPPVHHCRLCRNPTRLGATSIRDRTELRSC